MDKRIYGIRKLALLNSGGYARGEFPLDRALSISGPNNTGKSTAINALQFPFLCDRRLMSFPASDSATLEFYFPRENSFVVSEARTEFGTFVIGAAGLGNAQGNHYALFAYQKELDIEGDYLEQHPDSNNLANVRTLKDLTRHLAAQDVWLKKMSPKELLDVLAGVKRLNNTSMVGVFRMEDQSFLPLFVEIFKNLLQMEDLDMEKMKNILLKALLPNWEATSKNILRDYGRFDNEIKVEKNKLEAAKNLFSTAQELSFLNKQWDDLYWFLSSSYSHIISRYAEECEKQTKEIAREEKDFANIGQKIQHAKKLLEDLNEKRNGIVQAKKHVTKFLDDLEKEKKFFGPLSEDQIFSKENLLAQKKSLRKTVDNIIVNLKLAEGQSPQAIKSQITAKKQIIAKKKNILDSLKTNLVSEFKEHLTPDEIQILLKLFNKNLLMHFTVNDGPLNVHDSSVLMKQVRTVLSKCRDGFYKDGSLSVNLKKIDDIDIEVYLNKDSIDADIKQTLKEIENLKGYLQAAEDRNKQKQKKADLEEQIKKINQQIYRFEEYQKMLLNEPDWRESLCDLEQQFSRINAECRKTDEQKDSLVRQSVTGDTEIQNKKKRLEELTLNRAEVKPLPGLAGESMVAGDLSATHENEDFHTLVSQYVKNRKHAMTVKENIYKLFETVEANDGLRFIHGETIPERIKSLHNRTDAKSIELYKDMAQKIEDGHSLILVASLKDLIGKLEEFKTAIRAFNRSMNKNSISNIKEIKFFLEENVTVLKKIQALIESEPGTLFSRRSNEKFNQLMEAIQSGTILSLSNLFSLCISVELKNGKKMSFYGKSKIESNGTDLTIKAVLNIMILKKILRQKSDQVLNIPIYIDEAGQIDSENQKTLIKEFEAAGFVPVFASVEPQESAYYWIGLHKVGNQLYITPDDWYTLERIEKKESLS